MCRCFPCSLHAFASNTPNFPHPICIKYYCTQFPSLQRSEAAETPRQTKQREGNEFLPLERGAHTHHSGPHRARFPPSAAEECPALPAGLKTTASFTSSLPWMSPFLLPRVAQTSDLLGAFPGPALPAISSLPELVGPESLAPA